MSRVRTWIGLALQRQFVITRTRANGDFEVGQDGHLLRAYYQYTKSARGGSSLDAAPKPLQVAELQRKHFPVCISNSLFNARECWMDDRLATTDWDKEVASGFLSRLS